MDVIVDNGTVAFLTHSSEPILAISETTWACDFIWSLIEPNAPADALFKLKLCENGEAL